MPPDPQVVINPLSVTAPGGDRVMPIEASWGPSQEFLDNNQSWANDMDRMQLRAALDPKNPSKATAVSILEHNPNLGVGSHGGRSLSGSDGISYLVGLHGEFAGVEVNINTDSPIDPQNADPIQHGVGSEDSCRLCEGN
jgi:hypothetical protein